MEEKTSRSTWSLIPAGIVTDSGYQVELAIPFASLRFPERPEQTWRMNFWRDRQRDNRFRYSWTAQDRDNDCFICQWGSLTGIKDVKPGSSLDILPNILSYQSGSMANGAQPDSRFESRDPDAELSLNARYGLSTNSSLELTINPDFSQVESDAGQIDVNETHALFFDERRPFFQEGSDLYGSFFNIIYTRTINDPIVASKFTGQFGRFSLAYLLARDEHSPLIVPLREWSEGLSLEESTVNILRGRQTFGQDSYVGFVLTDRRTDAGQRVDTLYEALNDSVYDRSIDTVNYASGSGTSFGMDGRIRINRNLKFEFMAVGSHTLEPDGDGLLATGDYFDYGTKTGGAGRRIVLGARPYGGLVAGRTILGHGTGISGPVADLPSGQRLDLRQRSAGDRPVERSDVSPQQDLAGRMGSEALGRPDVHASRHRQCQSRHVRKRHPRRVVHSGDLYRFQEPDRTGVGICRQSRMVSG